MPRCTQQGSLCDGKRLLLHRVIDLATFENNGKASHGFSSKVRTGN